MKIKISALFLGILLAASFNAQALKGAVATSEEIAQLKAALSDGKVQVGKTRLKDIVANYGEPMDITTSNKIVTYDYGDLRIDFETTRFLKQWEYDSFKTPAYTKKINDLRFNLESQKIVGENITFTRIHKDFDEPTESHESNEDGKLSIYYYGNIKLIFENMFTVRSWRGKNLKSAEATVAVTPAVTSKPKVTPENNAPAKK